MRVDRERYRPSKLIILPDIRRNRGDRPAHVNLQSIFDPPRYLHSRRKTIQIELVAGLRVIEILLPFSGRRVHIEKARGAVRAFRDRGVNLPTKAIIEDETA